MAKRTLGLGSDVPSHRLDLGDRNIPPSVALLPERIALHVESQIREPLEHGPRRGTLELVHDASQRLIPVKPNKEMKVVEFTLDLQNLDCLLSRNVAELVQDERLDLVDDHRLPALG